MAFNNYVTLDGKKYKCPANNWKPVYNYPSTARPQWDGHLDVTRGPMSLVEWVGELRMDPGLDASWGTEADFLATADKSGSVAFTDHYGNSYTVYLQGPFTPRYLGPVWEAVTVFRSIRILRDS